MTDTAPTDPLEIHPSHSGTARYRSPRHGEIEIAYETLGPPDTEPLLLIMGIGASMHGWDPGFCASLVDAGFRVTRYDNRDTGRSTRFDAAGAPGHLRMALRPASAAAYRLEDMADDAIAVLDTHGTWSAHVVGVSQGGMIAQVLAIAHPERLRSLTSISSGPAARLGHPRASTLLALAGAVRRPVTDAESSVRQLVDVTAIVGSPGYPAEEADLRAMGRRNFEYEGVHDASAFRRHTAAVAASGDRRARLADVRVPTLVLHGEADRMIRSAAGRATADAVPGANYVPVPGMGHDLPRGLWPDVVGHIRALADRTDP
ncbi:MAG: alpha/beta fold hydrolase [Pseudonocardia sp.]|nr:alpha/beta fold hydrolase [Pseudonocardia sp.]